MKILFMGTGAADYDIKTRRDGEFFRRLTSVLIDDRLMIDCNIETLDFVDMNGTDLSGVGDLIITHTHSDHYSREAVNTLLGENATIHCDVGAMPRLGATEAAQESLELYRENKVGEYSIIPVRANHSVEGSDETPLNYIISSGGKTIFWGCDGAWLTNDAWHEMKKHKFDLVVLDGTLGDEEGDYRIFEHNNLRMITEMCGTIGRCGLMKDGGRIMISHMSKYSQYGHEELTARLEKYDITPAYDGLEVEV